MVVKTVLPIVKQCILNQTRGYWLFSDALNATLSTSVSLQNEIEQFDITSLNFVRADFESKLGALRI
jgi:hypothetical protein